MSYRRGNKSCNKCIIVESSLELANGLFETIWIWSDSFKNCNYICTNAQAFTGIKSESESRNFSINQTCTLYHRLIGIALESTDFRL